MTDETYLTRYLSILNHEITPNIDFDKLDASCNGADMEYAKEVLSQLHNAFCQVYGGNTIAQEDGFETVLLPGMIVSQGTGHKALALLDIDPSSQGEHWGTLVFDAEYGIVDLHLSSESSQKEIESAEKAMEKVGAYDYIYTPHLPDDIHISGQPPCPEAGDIVSYCRANETVVAQEAVQSFGAQEQTM